MSDLNWRPITYKAIALPTELIQHFMVEAGGFEPLPRRDEIYSLAAESDLLSSSINGAGNEIRTRTLSLED